MTHYNCQDNYQACLGHRRRVTERSLSPRGRQFSLNAPTAGGHSRRSGRPPHSGGFWRAWQDSFPIAASRAGICARDGFAFFHVRLRTGGSSAPAACHRQGSGLDVGREGAEFKRAARVLVEARDADGMLRLIEERTDMHYEDFDAPTKAEDG